MKNMVDDSMVNIVKNTKRAHIPDLEEYRRTLMQLGEAKKTRTLIAIRMGCEMGLSRIEIVNVKISDIDRINKRGLWIEIAKKVKRGKKYVARRREIPINFSLYTLIISYISGKEGDIYILHREKGDRNKPFSVRYINTLYEKNNVSWPTHRSRHFFKSQVWSWMQQHQQVDPGLMKEYLGHQKTTTEDYGANSWDYKRDVLDKVFG